MEDPWSSLSLPASLLISESNFSGIVLGFWQTKAREPGGWHRKTGFHIDWISRMTLGLIEPLYYLSCHTHGLWNPPSQWDSEWNSTVKGESKTWFIIISPIDLHSPHNNLPHSRKLEGISFVRSHDGIVCLCVREGCNPEHWQPSRYTQKSLTSSKWRGRKKTGAYYPKLLLQNDPTTPAAPMQRDMSWC